MNAILHFVLKHGYILLFGALFAHQIGFPLPGPLFLLAAGALAASGKLNIFVSISLAVTACVLADWIWYETGRRRGEPVLHFIHSFARDPEVHNRRAKAAFTRYGLPIFLIAKFVPGLDAVSPPLAGIARTSRIRFLASDAAGAGIYSFAYAGIGYLFSHDLDRAAAWVGRAGEVIAVLLLAGLFLYAVSRLLLRNRSPLDTDVPRIHQRLRVCTARPSQPTSNEEPGILTDEPLAAISSAAIEIAGERSDDNFLLGVAGEQATTSSGWRHSH